MSSSKKLIQAASGVGGGSFYDYEIENSIHLEPLSSGNPILSRTIGAGSQTNFTWSFWVKPPVVLPSTGYYSTGQLGVSGATVDTALRMTNNLSGGNPRLWPYAYNSGYIGQDITTSKYRDPSAWYHVVWAVDTTNATEADRSILYVNGVRQPVSQMNAWTLNGNTGHGTSGNNMYITRYGYMADVVVLDGTTASPTDLGELKNGVWVPKDPSGLSFGNNGFWLDFSNSGALGTDVSGNGNNWTVSGLTSSDQMIDTPTNNFCTWNPLDTINSPTISDGNLRMANSATGVSRATFGIPPNSGKWYWEAKQISTISGSSPVIFGMADYWGPPAHSAFNTGCLVYTDNGSNHGKFTSENNLSAPMSLDSTPVITGVAVNDVWQFMYDSDTGKFYVGVDETWYDATGGTTSNPSTDTNPFHTFSTQELGYLTPAMDHAGVATTQEYDFGQLGFTYTPPTDAKALCTANLPEPTIGANSTIKPEDCFATVLYTGNGTAIGSGGKAVTGVGFQPDMVWIKNRDATDQWMVFDSVRGATKYLSLDDDGNEVTDTETLTSFDADGFTLGNNVAVNTSGEDYVAYCFKITAGFFDIVSYTGTGITHTEAHSLGVVPNLLIPKNLSTTSRSWNIYCSSLPVADPETDFLKIDTNAAVADSNTLWNDTAPTSSVFTVGTNNSCNQSGDSFICYLFADVEGFCKTGYYKGNGSADGAFEYLGFSPQLRITKSSSLAQAWVVQDTVRTPANVNDDILLFDTPAAEVISSTNQSEDLLSNGVKLRATGNSHNATSADYITLSIGGNSIKYSNAR